MDWSKLRILIRDFIVPELKKRIDIHVTRYHDAHDGYGEVWITLDGKKIFGGGYYHWYMNSLPIDTTSLNIQHGIHLDFYKTHIMSEEVEKIMNSGLHKTSHITDNLKSYLSTPFTEMLSSNNPIYKAFGMIDKRLGKRRFRQIQLKENEHQLVRAFYELRNEIFEMYLTQVLE
ncbi:SF0329 family protein [Paenibacillus pseudetheri]|uniref:Uncharacterized protein n=1 Tax=Paenibacillus pseudetheri TaxID=2897682 RepID=A0ABM9BC72_9BACL|nr:hypothetical protein [Paenibacillus pseudetheri]CAH1056301.1 hypothetical protein PAECIP111894_02454 [Paenibacillus pseudetheri]